jgi:hypothetical protein
MARTRQAGGEGARIEQPQVVHTLPVRAGDTILLDLCCVSVHRARASSPPGILPQQPCVRFSRKQSLRHDAVRMVAYPRYMG